jgi:SSS family solute:Na+ symporter/sodium/proline symporter
MCEYLEKRYDSRFLKLAGTLVIFIFMIPYSAAVFMGLSYLFTSNFNLEYWHALLFIGIFTASYIVLGGYKSMAMIDMIFGIIMTGGVIILYFSTLNEGGGMAMITNTLEAIEPRLTRPIGPPGAWPLFSLIFLTSVAPFAMPQLVQKLYAIRDRRSIRIGMIASTFFALLIGGVAYYIGATTRVFITPGDPAFSHVFTGDIPMYDRLMPELLAKVIPGSLSVIILLLILSASMSTLAALVLISSSSLAKDFYHGFIRKDASDASLTRLMRLGSAFFVFLSVMLAWLNLDTIVSILGISWGALGSFFLGPFIWGILWKKSSRAGALASGILGLTICLGLYGTGMDSPSAGTIGMMSSLAINPIVSIFELKGSRSA